MAFSVPTFNLSVNLWSAPTKVAMAPTRSFLANLTLGRREAYSAGVWGDPGYTTFSMFLLCPKLTDIFPSDVAVWGDVVEVPAASGRYYIVACVDDVAKGFQNEYRIAGLLEATAYVVSRTTNVWAIPARTRPLA